MVMKLAPVGDPVREKLGPNSTNQAGLLVHGTAVRFCDKGVLLLGPSGVGKSDLAARLLDQGAVLVADDQLYIRLVDGDLHAHPPDRLRGLIALRGLGILRLPHQESRLDLVVDLSPSDVADDPLPEPMTASWLGVDLPKIYLDPRAPSAVVRIKMALEAERVL